ncbi:MAG TPA: IS1 family transposase [Mycobacteriales bacterium]|nr:IS1 family transposase [Mycobacteriales bacterium]
MNKLSPEKRAQVIGCLVEGMSIRGTVRTTGVAKNTIVKLLVDLGDVCSYAANELLVDVEAKRVQCDEIWSFCYSKQKNVPEDKIGEFGYGDIWTWTAIDADTKLVISYLVGDRSSYSAHRLMEDVSYRVTGRMQLTTDGHNAYLNAVEDTFHGDIDYAQLVKIYDAPSGQDNERRYSPAVCTGADKRRINGHPDEKHISTSYVERQNLTMRMSMRRFTRLTNAFSKKVENLAAAVSLHFVYYNFARPHQTLTKANGGRPTTPAMAAGKASRVWTLADIVRLLDYQLPE